MSNITQLERKHNYPGFTHIYKDNNDRLLGQAVPKTPQILRFHLTLEPRQMSHCYILSKKGMHLRISEILKFSCKQLHSVNQFQKGVYFKGTTVSTTDIITLKTGSFTRDVLLSFLKTESHNSRLWLAWNMLGR